MEKLDFQFIKDRGIGELIQDYFSLFKRIFKHLHTTILRFLLPFLAIFLVLVFFIITPGKNLITHSVGNEASLLSLAFLAGFLLLFFYTLFIGSFGIEYAFLLEEKRDFSFSSADVWQKIRQHLIKYIVFFFIAILVGLILIIPLGLIVFVLSFLPLIGQLAIGLLSACVSVVFICGLFLYLKNREDGVLASLMSSFRLIKQKIFIYGLSAFLFRILLSIFIGFIVIIPSVIIGIIAFTTTGIDASIFVSFGGKLLISIGGTILVLLIAVASIYMIIFYSLIYFSSLEATNKEATLEQIDQIGQDNNEREE